MCIRDRCWDNHTNRDEIALYRTYAGRGWLQDTFPDLEEGWIVNAYGERVRVNLLWQRRAIGSIEDQLRKALSIANWTQAQRLIHEAIK
eukprot:6920969-Prorocentrum_lima.AAC.1